MDTVLWVVLAISMTFGLVVFFGAPYLPTMAEQRQIALGLLKLKRGDIFVDIGCGDGSMLIAAAERGLTAMGMELNPILVIIAKIRTRKYGGKVSVGWGNFWWSKQQLTQADGIFAFLRTRYMAKLDRLVAQSRTEKPAKLATYAFKIPGKHPVLQSKGVYLYQYPSIARKR